METDIKSLQMKILEIVTYLDKFCKERNITYYLMGGSALGALRHKGFIPWDDDLDVFMTFDNYQKFLKYAREELDIKEFYLQEENTEEWPMFFTKIRMNGTTFLEENTKNSKMHQGVYIDIMCLNNTSSNIIYRYLQYCAALLLTAQTLEMRGYPENHSLIKKIAMKGARFLVKGRVKKNIINFVRGLNSKPTKNIGHFFGKAPFKRTSFPLEWLGTPRYVSFENTQLPIPQEAEKYLSMRFGDFMELPDEKTLKQYPIHASFVDLTKDYTEYI